MKEKIYSLLPVFFQNLLISLFNILAYNKRYGGNYEFYLKQFKLNQGLSIQELKKKQEEKFQKLLIHANNNSSFYEKLYKGIDLNSISIENIDRLPIVEKEMLRKNIKDIYTVSKKEGIVSKTGGTTGKSLEVRFTKDNMQERFAALDFFRGKFGYELGKKTAWFSGKNILSGRDLRKNRFWKTDYYHKVRYYSTFHIKEDYLSKYVEDLMKYQPEYIVGFPSTIMEIAKFGLKIGRKFAPNRVKAIFPTAESITDEMRELIGDFFNTKIFDQYASSEGAPFIFECEKGNLHVDMESGVFEVLDNNNQSAQIGRLVVTSFTTYGTPLIRYDIGDYVRLSDEVCNCGDCNPLVESILGRVDDFVFSPKNGKINLGNISNTLKDVKGIIKFQVVQDYLNEIRIYIIKDDAFYNNKYERKFLENWRDRVGSEMKIELIFVKEILTEKSGKFRMVKNNIKHLL